METESKKQGKWRVTGKVQNVGFRGFLQRHAQQRNICGYARNERDGSVTVLLCGSEEAYQQMLDIVGNNEVTSQPAPPIELRIEADDEAHLNEPFAILG